MLSKSHTKVKKAHLTLDSCELKISKERSNEFKKAFRGNHNQELKAGNLNRDFRQPNLKKERKKKAREVNSGRRKLYSTVG